MLQFLLNFQFVCSVVKQRSLFSNAFLFVKTERCGSLFVFVKNSKIKTKL